jgi:RND family efflux transporter MFP subunit
MIPILRVLRAAAGSDRDLLDRYARDRDEQAFEALVQRYGTGVWAACVRLAGPDAEDAFQAVFLTLSRKAGAVTGSLPAWLHAVTRRVASTLRRAARRRAALEGAAARPDRAPAPDPTLREGLALLDEELARLPERYRAVLIVCCLEGRSRDEAAAQLGWTGGQVKGRLERAREVLRTRLARRGVELGGILLAAAVCGPAPARVAPSPEILSLARGVMRDMAIHKYRLGVAVLAAAVVGLGALLAGGRTGDEKEKPRPPEKAAGAPQGWDFVGRAQAAAAVEIRARVTGYLTRVAVKEGAAVKKGDVLAEVLPRPYQLDLDAAKARMRAAAAKLKLAKLKTANTRKLVQNKVVSQDELDLYEAAEAEAEAGLAVARVEVDRAEMNLTLTQIRTPIDGRVSRVHATEGNLVVADQTPVLTVVATDRLYVSFNVPEGLLLRLRRDGLADPDKLGVAVGFAGVEGFPYEAKLDVIAPEVDPATGVARFRAVLANPQGLVSPGMSAHVRLTPPAK